MKKECAVPASEIAWWLPLLFTADVLLVGTRKELVNKLTLQPTLKC